MKQVDYGCRFQCLNNGSAKNNTNNNRITCIAVTNGTDSCRVSAVRLISAMPPKLDDGFFVEPYGQLATAIIQRQSYELDNGLQAKGARTASVVGKAGPTVGRDIQLDGGSVLQPYLRAAVAHEFNQSNKVSVNGNSFNNDLSGTRVEMATGLAMAVSKNWKVHADVERSMGKSVDQPWGVNVGGAV